MLAAAAGDGPLGVERRRSPRQAIGAGPQVRLPHALAQRPAGVGGRGKTVVTREGTEPQAGPGLEVEGS